MEENTRKCVEDMTALPVVVSTRLNEIGAYDHGLLPMRCEHRFEHFQQMTEPDEPQLLLSSTRDSGCRCLFTVRILR
jgi:hypothetical protein